MPKEPVEISVILPSLYCDSLLDAAVTSVLTQQGPAFEILVLFDGTPVVEQREWMSDPRVEVIHSSRRRGLSATLVDGIRRARAETIARIDADDLCEQGRLASQFSWLMSNSDAVLVGSLAARIDLAAKPLGPFPTSPGEDVRAQLVGRNVIIHSSAMFRREAYDRAGGFDEKMSQMEDYDLWLRMGLLGPIGIMNRSLIQYRIHPGQVSRGAKPFGYHMRKVRRGQASLSRHIGIRRLEASYARFRWTTAQFLRYFRLRKPGYDVDA